MKRVRHAARCRGVAQGGEAAYCSDFATLNPR